MKQQDLVWVRLPFSSFEDTKVRPAIVVSNNGYNASTRDVIVCAITSRLDPKRYSCIVDNDSLSSGTLPFKSRVRADKVLQIEKSLVIHAFATLKDEAFDKLVKEVTRLIKRGK